MLSKPESRWRGLVSQPCMGEVGWVPGLTDFDPARQSPGSQRLIERPRIGRFAVCKHGPDSRLQWRHHACGQPCADEPCEYIPCPPWPGSHCL